MLIKDKNSAIDTIQIDFMRHNSTAFSGSYNVTICHYSTDLIDYKCINSSKIESLVTFIVK